MVLASGVKALNLGCGTSVAPGWINLDNSPNARLSKRPLLRKLLWKFKILSDQHYAVRWPADIQIHDLNKPLPFADNTIDYAYASHVLEHFAPLDGQKFLKEICRVLKKGGLVRIVVPDLAIGIRNYLSALEANPDDAQAAHKFVHWLNMTKPKHRDPHLMMYDIASLRDALIQAGFENPVVCEHKQGHVPDCEILDNRPEDSLHVEATKPA